jgi:hypothetical protein
MPPPIRPSLPEGAFLRELPQDRPAPLTPPAGSLAELAGEVRFFTPAVFHLAGLAQDLLDAWRLDGPGRPEVPLLLFERPLFLGLQHPGSRVPWDRALGACPLDWWPSLLGFLEGTAVVDRAAGKAAVATWRDCLVRDPVAARDGRHSLVKVAAFGLHGVNRRYGLGNAEPPDWRAPLRSGEPRPELALAAAALLQDPDAAALTVDPARTP